MVWGGALHIYASQELWGQRCIVSCDTLHLHPGFPLSVKDCLKIMYFPINGFERSQRDLYSSSHHYPPLWLGRRAGRRWRRLEKDLGLGDKLQITATDVSDVQVTDFYWTLWGIELFVRKWKNVCAYKIIWKINAVLSIFFSYLESRTVLQPILASSERGRDVCKHRQGGWAERSSCCLLLLFFTWRSTRGAMKWCRPCRVPDAVVGLQLLAAMLRTALHRQLWSLDLSLVVLFVGSNLGDLSTESLSQMGWAPPGELGGHKACFGWGDKSCLKCERVGAPPCLSGPRVVNHQ